MVTTMLKLLHKIFASLAQATGGDTRPQSPYTSTYSLDRMSTGFRSEVENNLGRWFGKAVERRNSHIPTLSSNQLDQDLASTTRRRARRGHSDHTRYLKDGYVIPGQPGRDDD
jgi:hypothetical protein